MAIQMLSENNYDLSLIDLYLPKADGFQVLAHLQRVSSSTSAIVMTGYGSIESAVEAMKRGAADYLTKPVAFDQLRIVVKKALDVRRLQQENWLLRHQLKTKYRFENLVGTSPAMQQVFQLIEKVADVESTVLILGDSGTGKELVARAIHFNSHRAEKPLVPVNCGAIPESLLESELFGHERGAFTGAARTRIGRFELANGGTIFLDEVGDMSPALQVKLLRVLQEQSFERVGGTRSLRVDVRIIAATNRNLEESIVRGEFREDLYYRLSVIPLNLPPLRERKRTFRYSCTTSWISSTGCMTGSCVDSRPSSAHAHELPLARKCPRVGELSGSSGVLKGQGIIEPEDLPEKMRTAWTPPPAALGVETLPTPPVRTVEIHEKGFSLDIAVREFERELIPQALQQADGVKNKAALLLGIKRTTLIEKLKRHCAASSRITPAPLTLSRLTWPGDHRASSCRQPSMSGRTWLPPAGIPPHLS